MNNYTDLLLKQHSFEILNYYLKPHNKNMPLKQGKTISNPFLNQKQKTPSFNIFYSKGKQSWLYNDFATGDKGNCIELVKQLFKIPFKDAMDKIRSDMPELFNDDFSLLSSKSEITEKQNFSRQDMLLKRNFSTQELEYWKSYGITAEILKEYAVYAIDYKNSFKENNLPDAFFPVFAYKYKNAFKVYRPFAKNQRFFFKGEKPQEFYFGFDQLLESGEFVILTGGEKDVMSLKAKGFPALTLNSETALPSDLLLKQLKDRFDHVLILYDNDETGKRKSSEISQKFSLIRVELPSRDGLKDISDFFKAGFSVKDLEILISDALKNYEPKNLKEKRVSWSNIADSPLISDRIYENLPPFLKDVCMVQKDKRSRDSVLISALTTLSGCLPNVFGEYGGRTYYPNLFCFVIAPPASGKGNLALIRYLAEDVHQAIIKDCKEHYSRYKEEMKAYKDPKRTYEMAEPVKPDFKILLIPANTSHAAMMEQLYQNKGVAIIFDTEADALGNAFKNEWGNYSEMLRKAWPHEAISSLRKLEMRYIDILDPRISVILSGTPNQTIAIIKSAEDGLLSRFIFYVFTGDPIWLDVSPEGNKTNLTEHYKQCGKKVKEMYDHFLRNPCEIKLTSSQWDQLNKFGDRSLKDVHTFLTDEALSIPKRLGVILFRFAMILTCIRAFESNAKDSELYCSDEDFQTSLGICEMLLEHAKLVYVNLPQSACILDPMKQKLFDMLPSGWFSSKEAETLGKSFNLSDRAVRGYLKAFSDKGLLGKGKLGQYCKHTLPGLPSLPDLKVA